MSKLILKSESGNNDENLLVITAVYGIDELARLYGALQVVVSNSVNEFLNNLCPLQSLANPPGALLDSALYGGHPGANFNF